MWEYSFVVLIRLLFAGYPLHVVDGRGAWSVGRLVGWSTRRIFPPPSKPSDLDKPSIKKATDGTHIDRGTANAIVNYGGIFANGTATGDRRQTI